MFERYCRDLKPVNCNCCSKTPERLRQCSACKVTKYCDVNCQRNHWRTHKKQCKELGDRKERFACMAENDLENRSDASGMFIFGVRLGSGDCGHIDHELTCKLYEAAAQVETPIAGGHPNAMLHLALHYERGLGVEQSYERAYDLYKSVVDHPFPGEETTKHALLALSRFHEHGLGGVVKDSELKAKYFAFSQSNPERVEEIHDLEDWWTNRGGKSIIMSHMEAAAVSDVNSD